MRQRNWKRLIAGDTVKLVDPGSMLNGEIITIQPGGKYTWWDGSGNDIASLSPDRIKHLKLTPATRARLKAVTREIDSERGCVMEAYRAYMREVHEMYPELGAFDPCENLHLGDLVEKHILRPLCDLLGCYHGGVRTIPPKHAPLPDGPVPPRPGGEMTTTPTPAPAPDTAALIADGQHHYSYRDHSGDHKTFTLWKEGNVYMALHGPNIQEGYCEFGETPELAAANFRSKHEQQ